MEELFYNAREVSLATAKNMLLDGNNPPTAKEVINYANELYEYLVQDIN